MRKFMLLTALVIGACVLWVNNGTACWRTRAGRYYRHGMAPMIRLYCAPSGPALPPVAAAKFYTSPKGNTYWVIPTGERTERPDERRLPSPQELLARPSGTSQADLFAGTDRKAAKLSISTAPAESFADLGALLDSLPADAAMAKAPGMSQAEDSRRLPQEERNVTVDAFIYAASKETDNDYHLILGGNPSGMVIRYMNAEVSGLPASGPFLDTLKAARKQFTDPFGSLIPPTGYHRFNPPVPVKVSGSLFFDVRHYPPGDVGPSGRKPKTAWEIHPITNLVIEP
jgi:hypothetical protein